MGFDLLGQTNMFCLIMYDDAPSSLSLSSFMNIFYSESFFKKQTNKQKPHQTRDLLALKKIFFN